MSESKRDELDRIRSSSADESASRKWVVGQQAVYKDGYRDGFDKCREILSLEIEKLTELLIARNQNAVLAVENYNRINGLRNQANDKYDQLHEDIKPLLAALDKAHWAMNHLAELACHNDPCITVTGLDVCSVAHADFKKKYPATQDKGEV